MRIFETIVWSEMKKNFLSFKLQFFKLLNSLFIPVFPECN